MVTRWISPLAALLLAACARHVTPEQAVATAYSYTQVEWMPEDRHVRHGHDADGKLVHTPDKSLARHGNPNGWWQPGVMAKSMPYKWGGFDTPESFLSGLKKGRKAGDIATISKIKSGPDGVSRESVGVDCSGFVSRCWNLERQYSTRELPGISTRLDSWDELKAGDILLKNGHVVLFVKFADDGKTAVGYEAGPLPKWRVNACGLNVAWLKREGYSPWRYNRMRHKPGIDRSKGE